MILHAPWLTEEKRKKYYNKPGIRSELADLEVRATREWKIFYSVHRREEHERIYGCGNCPRKLCLECGRYKR